jgi:L-alanine-DL-glutamate epimerase-like enolase superfamily enzyme
VGGISETVRQAQLAAAFNVPVTMHDCTGPLTLLSGMHVNAAVAGCCFQETVRAHIRTFYKDLIDAKINIAGGYTDLPAGAGIGARLNPDLFKADRAGYRRSEVAAPSAKKS